MTDNLYGRTTMRDATAPLPGNFVSSICRDWTPAI